MAMEIPATQPGADARTKSVPCGKRYTLIDKLFYGLGSVAFGVKDNGFSVLLMLFYNQALGVPAAKVGFAIMIALVIDAICDPLIGNWSDGLRSRLGRRHPFMYIAAIPVAVSYYFLWNPPAGWSPDQLFTYLLVMSIIIRVFISFYEIPSSALVVDLAEDYDERTSFLSFRYFFGWVGGLTMGVAAFSVFLRPGPNDPSGQLNLQGYSHYGLTAALIMIAAILISSLGTQRHVAHFRAAPPKREFMFSRSALEVWQTLATKPFLLLFFATLFSYTGLGIGGALLTYFRIYYWGLTGNQISFLMVGNFGSVALALFITPLIAAKMGKKNAAIAFGVIGLFNSPAMYLGRLLNLVPENGSNLLYWMLFGQSFIGATLLMSGGIVGSAMLADVVEYSALRTGRHSAGLLFSANAFILKALSGIGVFGAGIILSFVGFPEGAKQGAVSPAILTRLAITEPTVLFVLALASLSLILAFPITRQMHANNLRKLAAREEDVEIIRATV